MTKKAMCIFCTFQIPTSLLCIIAWMSSYVLIDNYIDDVVYVFGASLKDAGKKLFAYIRMQETSASELLNNIRYLSIIDGTTESFLGGKTMD